MPGNQLNTCESCFSDPWLHIFSNLINFEFRTILGVVHLVFLILIPPHIVHILESRDYILTLVELHYAILLHLSDECNLFITVCVFDLNVNMLNPLGRE